MARLRYSFSEAEAEATRLAKEFVSQNPEWNEAILLLVAPSNIEAKSSVSKFPISWTACFAFPHPPDVVVDGGELVIDVNIETKHVQLWDEW